MIEPLRGGEFELVSQRFRSFIEGHTSEAADGMIGSLRDGIYHLTNLTNQLIPVNKVKFSKFNEGELDDESREDGFVIELLYDDINRYGLQLRHGSFNEWDNDYGIDFDRNIEPSIVSGLIDAFEMLESDSKLVPITED